MTPTTFAELRFDPSAILNEIWRRLEVAAHTPDATFRLAALGTTGLDQSCSVRTIVLRAVDPLGRRLYCHTDRRSPKLAELQADPRATWLFYDPAERVQLRITSRVTIHLDDAIAEARWLATGLDGRRAYLAPAAPGTPCAAAYVNLPEHVRTRLPTEAESAAGRPHFAVLAGAVQTLDWYYLHPEGHLRLRFAWRGDAVEWTWLAS